jgi:hypothetical protein
MMDKKTIWVIAGCLIALVVFNWAVDKLYPPKPKLLTPAMVSATTNEPSAAVTNVVNETAKIEKKAKVEKAPTIEPAKPRTAEKIAVLVNDYVQATFTSWGGGIRSVELKQHHVNNGGNVMLNVDSPSRHMSWNNRMVGRSCSEARESKRSSL